MIRWLQTLWLSSWFKLAMRCMKMCHMWEFCVTWDENDSADESGPVRILIFAQTKYWYSQYRVAVWREMDKPHDRPNQAQ